MTPNDGKLLADIWAYQLPSSGLSGAGVKDAIRGALPGVKTHEGEWAPVEITGIEVGADEKRGGKWTGRSKFGSAMTGTKQVSNSPPLNTLRRLKCADADSCL